MKLNEKMLECRKKMGISQEELAHRVGVSRQAVSKWELGDAVPEVDKIVALAQIFQITTDELLGLEQKENETEQYENREPENFEQRVQQQEALPGVLRMFGRVIRKWGHVAGYIIALRGLGVTVIGAIARWMFGKVASLTVHTDSSYMTISQNGFPAAKVEEWMQSAPDYLMTTPFDTFDTMFNIPLTLANCIIVIGVCMMAGGLALSWYLKKHRIEE